MFLLKHHIPLRPRPRLGVNSQLLGEMREADLDMGDVLGNPLARNLLRTALPPVMHRLIIYPDIRGRARRAEPVDRDPGADFVGRPGVAVRPVVQLLVDPREQRDGRVGERVAECLRLGRLLGAVAGAFGEEPSRAREAVALARRVGGQGVLGGRRCPC
jgi:hypothetical protein